MTPTTSSLARSFALRTSMLTLESRRRLSVFPRSCASRRIFPVASSRFATTTIRPQDLRDSAGQPGNAAQPVGFGYFLNDLLVVDEGEGFDPASVPTEIQPGDVLRESGRGIFLMRAYMDEVHFGEGGRRVELVKRRSGERAEALRAEVA